MTRDDEVEALRARVGRLARENEALRASEAHLQDRLDAERLAAEMLDRDPTGQDAEGAYVHGCGEHDTVDSKGRPLVNGGRTCNDANEPYWM